METGNIELYLISGFLGSGKTTFLQRLLDNQDISRVGVIINEYGSVNIDGKLVENEDLKMVEINNGSVFCACIKGGFVKTLAAFLQQPVDKLYVEASGMADPSSIEALLAELEPLIQKKFKTDRRYDYKGCTCIVDAGHFIPLSSSILAPVKQVQKSDLVVVNKVDTVTPKGLDQVHETILEIHPGAKIYDTTYAQVPLEVIHASLQGEGAWQAVSVNLPNNRPFGGILTLPEVIDRDKLYSFMKTIGEKMYRVKGFFFDGTSCYHVSNVAEDIRIEASKKKRKPQLVLIGPSADNLVQWVEAQWNQYFDMPFEFEEE